MDNGSSDPIPPGAERVAARALALAAVAGRGVLELEDDKELAETRRLRLCDWLTLGGIVDELEESEDLLIRTPVGDLDERRMIDANWRCEGALVLAWSLRRAELIAPDEDCDSGEVADQLGFFRPRFDTALARPTLRERAEIAHWTDTYLTIHWRLRQFTIDPQPIDFADWVAHKNWGPLTLADVALVEGDLCIQGQRLDCVPEDWRHHMLSIAQERHQAFNWLMGVAPIYSEVPTDT
jgi:hypothetical protein